jgi:hypothetical protein
MEMRHRLIAALIAGLWSAGALAQTLPATPPPSPYDLCRQQLMGLHSSTDEMERNSVAALAAVEAQKATLIEWLKAAQAGGKK